MNPVATLLLAGDPVGAVALATDRLLAGDLAEDHLHRLRANVWIGRIDTTEADAAHLDADVPLHRVGLALHALCHGHPSRARLLLEGSPPEKPDDAVLYALTHAECSRASGDAAAALQHAGRAAMDAQGLDPRWEPAARLVLGRCLSTAGDLDLAAQVLQQAVGGFGRLLPGTVALAEALDARGQVERQRNNPVGALTWHRQALELWMQLGAATAPVANCSFQLAQALHRTGDLEGALETMEAAFLATHTALGPDHLDTWTTRFELGRLEVDAGDPFTGMPRMEAAHAEVLRRLGPQHPIVRSMRVYLGPSRER